MSDSEEDGSNFELELAHDPEAMRALGTETTENLRFQKYFKESTYPPGYKIENEAEQMTEVIEQPPVSIKTGFQATVTSAHVLFGANGPDIHSFHLTDKTHLSSWRYPKDKNFPNIPEALTQILNPNKQNWEFQDEEKDKMANKVEPKAKRALVKAKKDAGGTGSPDPKRRKLGGKDAEPEAKGTNGTEHNFDEMPDVTKGTSSDGDVDKLDPFPARPVNPEVWEAGNEDKENDKLKTLANIGEIPDIKDDKPEALANNGGNMAIGNIEYEISSVRPPDVAPEGYAPDNLKNWRRPEFRPNRRPEWKQQVSTATPDIPMIQCMVVTKDGKHLVAVTGSDKTIWVFEHDGNGKLTKISQRTMPKRPNAIAFAKNERTLVVADKFGDVYTLPLIERKDISSLKGTPTPAVPSRSATPAVVKPFQTQANDKTVHSKRNLQALENQKKQAQKEGSSTPKPGAKSGINPKKDPTGDFYHKLIMGHVSMLTDIVVGKVGTVDPKSGKTLFRESIITADRDEHIRVSRGMPQSHVVEHFLHGHKEFVSRIHIPERYPNILISGGGDSYIYVWDYVKKELLSKQDMRSQVVKNDFDHDTAYESLLAVSGIVSYYDNAIGQTRVFVICENIPKLFNFNIDDSQVLRTGKDTPLNFTTGRTARRLLAGNPLGLATFSTGGSQGIVVSYDPLAAGTAVYPSSDPTFIQTIVHQGFTGPPIISTFSVAASLSQPIAFSFRGEWERALYSIEPLRKNAFDRDVAQKDGEGVGATTSTG